MSSSVHFFRMAGRACAFFVLLALIVLLSEAIFRSSLSEAIIWARSQFPAFLLNVALLSLLALVLAFILPWPILFAAISVLLFGLGLANRIKIETLGSPVFPWDLLLYRQYRPVLEFFVEPWVVSILLLLSSLAAAGAVVYIIRARRHGAFFLRGSISLGAALALYGLAIMPDFTFQDTRLSFIRMRTALTQLNVEYLAWDQKENYRKNGQIVAFLFNLKSGLISPPEGYTRDNIDAAFGHAAPRAVGSTVAVGTQHDRTRPHVIAILSETFWDPARLKGPVFTRPPAPLLSGASAPNLVVGNAFVPVFAGATCNTEFEFLTGFTMAFLPTGSLPFQQYVNASIPSLASRFAGAGYRTIGVHPYHAWFWNRKEVYRHFSFSRFLALEAFDPPASGPYVSDDALANKIIELTSGSAEPTFIFAVTMGNHYPWDRDRFASAGPVEVSWNPDVPLSARSKRRIETYSKGVREANNALEKLIAHFSAPDARPTVILLFGDHLPILGDDYRAYVESGYVPNPFPTTWSHDQSLAMHSAPFVLWSNFPLHNKPTAEPIGINFLGTLLVENAGLELTPFGRLNRRVAEAYPVLSTFLVRDARGAFRETQIAKQDPLLNSYRLIQYDTLFGDRLGAGYFSSGSAGAATVPGGRQGLAERTP